MVSNPGWSECVEYYYIGKVYQIGKKGVLPAKTAVAEQLGLWCIELRVAGSNPAC